MFGTALLIDTSQLISADLPRQLGRALDLVDTTVIRSGVAILTYRPAD
jgi:hypothetical protein